MNLFWLLFVNHFHFSLFYEVLKVLFTHFHFSPHCLWITFTFTWQLFGPLPGSGRPEFCLWITFFFCEHFYFHSETILAILLLPGLKIPSGPGFWVIFKSFYFEWQYFCESFSLSSETIVATSWSPDPLWPRVLGNFKFSSNSVKILCNVVKDLVKQVNNVAPDVNL